LGAGCRQDGGCGKGKEQRVWNDPEIGGRKKEKRRIEFLARQWVCQEQTSRSKIGRRRGRKRIG